MRITQKFVNIIVLIFALSPIAYLLLVWNQMPETVRARFNFSEPELIEQSRQSLLISVIVVSVLAAGLYFLLRNLKMVDPKVKAGTPMGGFNRMGMAATFFLVVLNYFVILTALNSWEVSQNVLFVFLALLIAVVGNYIYNIRPNFFAGLRLPWTLKDENNWRLTHHLAGKLWFAGGLLLAIICAFLSQAALKPVFITVLVIMLLIPTIYSYRLYKHKK